MNFAQFIATLVLAAAIAFGAIEYHEQQKAAEAPPKPVVKESTFDRVMRTNVLRCGYAVAAPWFTQEASTGAKGGIGYDVAQAVADKIGVRLEWAEETGWGGAEEGLANDKFDMLCAPICVDPKRARTATFSTPMVSIPLIAVAREDNQALGAEGKPLNAPDVKIAVKRGERTETVAAERFPATQKVFIDDQAHESDLILAVTSGKADMTFISPQIMRDYNAKSDQKIRAIGEPVHSCDAAFMMPMGEGRLKHLVDTALMELNTSGVLAMIMQQNLKQDADLARLPAFPFR
jgi:ABC-type amino acid transport substrate-binding protein